MIAKKARDAAGPAAGLVVMAAVAVLAAACSHGGTSAAGSTSSASAPGVSPSVSASPSGAGGTPADTSAASPGNPVSPGNPASPSDPAASAVAVSGAAPPSASAPAQLPASSAAAGTTSCATWAASHTFLYVTSATPNADGSLTVTGNHATVVCGGPDDYHYDFAAATVTGRVLSGAALRVLSSGAQLQPLTLPKFPAYLTSDKNTRVFMFTGTLTGITTLAEQYHP